MKNETRIILEQYVEKAHKLRDFGFVEHAKSLGRGWSAKRTDNDEWVMEFGIPDLKEQDAFFTDFSHVYSKKRIYFVS